MQNDYTAFAREFLDTIWQDQPLSATAMGVHDYDDPLRVFSLAGWTRQQRHLNDLERKAAALLVEATLTRSQRIDLELAQRFTALTRALWEAQPPWEQPDLYAGLPSGSLFTLLVREFAPLQERARAMRARLRQVPVMLAEARRTLVKPARLRTEIALETTRGSLEFLKTVIPLVAERAPEAGGPLRAAAETAADALRDYARFLQDAVLPRSTGETRIGQTLFDRILREEHALSLTADDLDRIGRRSIEETRAELAEIAARIEAGTPWTELLTRAKAEHVPTPEAVRPAYETAMERARHFVVERHLVTLPPGERLEFVDTPEFLRPLTPFMAYLAPAPFEPEQKGFFGITPIDLTAPPEVQTQQLRGHNRYAVELGAVHEAYPGHHVQALHANAHPSPLRRFFGNALFCEGWALYCEEMMQEEGFGLELMSRLMQRSAQFWRACRVVIDVGLHTRGMEIEEAVRWLVEEALLEEPQARSEVKRYMLTPTQPMSYLIGKQEILRLREEYRAASGGRWTLGGFHDDLLSHGTIPPAYVRREMFGEEENE